MAGPRPGCRARRRLAARPAGTRVSRAAVTAVAEIVVTVTITDRHGTEVVHADITTWVSPAG